MNAVMKGVTDLRSQDGGVLSDEVTKGRAGLGLPSALSQHNCPLHQLLHSDATDVIQLRSLRRARQQTNRELVD